MKIKLSNVVKCFILFGFISCGEDAVEQTPEIPQEWKGENSDFENEFVAKTNGNETLILHRVTAKPFGGKVDRHGKSFTTTQNFENGKLNGRSIKKSFDGSWVEANYLDGKLNGEMIFYSKDGTRRSVLFFENGVLKKDLK